jgi:hypothetical protein
MALVLLACKKTAAPLPLRVAEERGNDSQNRRRLTLAELDHMIPVPI